MSMTVTDDEIDEVFDAVDELLLAGSFSVVDDILKSHKPEDHPTVMNILLLTITVTASLDLPSWFDLLQRIRDHLLTIETKEEVNLLLLGFPKTPQEAEKFRGTEK